MGTPAEPTTLTINQFSTLANVIPVLQIDKMYIGLGEFDTAGIGATLDTSGHLTDFLATTAMAEFGEGAEKQLTIQSEVETAKTAHYEIETKRNTTVEMLLTGIAEDKKNELEAFSEEGTIVTIIARLYDPLEFVLINAVAVSVSWGANDQELATFTVKATVQGKTNANNRIRFFKLVA